jgi:hypothetical protein
MYKGNRNQRTAPTSSSESTPSMGESSTPMDLPRDKTGIQDPMDKFSPNKQMAPQSQDLTHRYRVRKPRNTKTCSRPNRNTNPKTSQVNLSYRGGPQEKWKEEIDSFKHRNSNWNPSPP